MTETNDNDKEKSDGRLEDIVEAVEECRESIRQLAKILDGLTEFANIRDLEDAGDWVVVANTSDLVSRQLKDLDSNLNEAIDLCDTGDL